jgi:hypothetical protein
MAINGDSLPVLDAGDECFLFLVEVPIRIERIAESGSLKSDSYSPFLCVPVEPRLPVFVLPGHEPSSIISHSSLSASWVLFIERDLMGMQKLELMSTSFPRLSSTSFHFGLPSAFRLSDPKVPT